MKKKIIIILITLLFITGCTCEYDLQINDNNYSETIKIIAENNEEVNRLNGERRIPIDKEVLNDLTKESTEAEYEKYNYKVTNNVLTFNYDFNEDNIINSSAISSCFDRITILQQGSATILSTSNTVKCFDSYPGLNKVTITISVDKDVISNNADYVSGNKYVWNLNKNDKNKKSINITIDNKSSEEIQIEENHKNKKDPEDGPVEDKPKKNDYSLYIFCGILLIVMLIAYYFYNKLKNSEMND